jgi:hypothetical protein
MLISLLIVVAMTAVCCSFWVWRILRSRPSFHELYCKEATLHMALRKKFCGIKQKLSTVVVIAASSVVSLYDFFSPIVSGVDVTPLVQKVPSWAWPLVLIATTALLQYCRNLADKRHATELARATALRRAA